MKCITMIWFMKCITMIWFKSRQRAVVAKRQDRVYRACTRAYRDRAHVHTEIISNRVRQHLSMTLHSTHAQDLVSCFGST